VPPFWPGRRCRTVQGESLKGSAAVFPNFVPSPDKLVLFELLHKQVTGNAAMSHIIIVTMRLRFAESGQVMERRKAP
jgi:hypothetical protein